MRNNNEVSLARSSASEHLIFMAASSNTCMKTWYAYSKMEQIAVIRKLRITAVGMKRHEIKNTDHTKSIMLKYIEQDGLCKSNFDRFIKELGCPILDNKIEGVV